MIFYLNVSIANNEFCRRDEKPGFGVFSIVAHFLCATCVALVCDLCDFCYFVDGSGISRRYFPLPEILSFQVLTSMTFVAWNLSSRKSARKGLQKRE